MAAACAASLAACSSKDRARHCQNSSECDPGSRCLAQSCVADAPPVAVLATPSGTLEEFSLVTFDAGGSYDPDAPSDSVASFTWSFASVDAPCDAPLSASTSAQSIVRFACAGTYAVTVVATDELSARSAPATVQIAIGAHSGPLLVTAGPDVAVDHVCAGTSPVCTVVGGAVQLAATPAPEAPVGLSYHWAVQPPANRPLDSTRRIVFSPSADAAAPTARIETDGTAISGDWVFQVEARDAAGVVAVAATVVHVGNSPPVVSATVPASFPHAFSATLSQLSSEGAIPFTVTDPDGDPVAQRTLAHHHSGDGGATFDVALLGGPDRVAFSIVLPYSQPSDALYLRAEAGGPVRTIDFSISDVNGATTSQSWPVVIGNQVPRATYAAPAPANHTFDVATSRYLADVTVGTWVDDDGDPLVQYGTTGDTACATVEMIGGAGVVHCQMAFSGTPAVNLFAGSHPVAVGIGDPWVSAPVSTVAITIADRAPAVGAARGTATGTCTAGTCCQHDPEIPTRCIAYKQTFDGGTGSATPIVSDPDGDPLAISSPAFATYVAVSPADVLPVPAYVPAATACIEPTISTVVSSTTVTVSAGDGAASASGTVTISAYCG